MKQAVEALVIQVSAGSISKDQSSLLNIKVNYTWKGPAKTITGYGVVTQETWYSEFDEIGSTKKSFSVSLPEAKTAVSGSFTITNLPLSGCEAGKWYGVKVHLDNVDEWGAKSCLYIYTVTYSLEITAVDYPSSAKSGATVTVKVTLKNTSSMATDLLPMLVYDSNELYFSPEYYYLAAGSSYTFSTSFTMPNKSLTAYIYGYYWDGSKWVKYATKTITISLTTVAAYLEITSVSAPSSASSGQKVTVSVTLKNTYTSGLNLAPTGVYDSTEFSFSPEYSWASAGGSVSFSGSFTMPNKSVTVTIYAYYWDGSKWVHVATRTVTISKV